MKFPLNSQSQPEPGELTGPRYWRSLDEWAEKPEFKEWLHREFPQGASEVDGVNRRGFMKIMAASFAAAGLGAAGCRRPEQYILPYSKQPENSIPGVPVFYATSFPDARDSLPLVVETHQNRPTHIEGNQKFAPYGGALNAFATASVLNLYDPDRMTSSYEGQQRIDRDRVKDLIAGLNAKYGPTKGQGLAILAEPSSSPTRLHMKRALKMTFPRMVWAEYNPTQLANDERAARHLFGEPARGIYNFREAKRVLSIDSDFMNKASGSLRLARDFAAGRRVKDKEDAHKMNRLYAVESHFTVTGSMADHRLRLATSHATAFIARLTAEVMDLVGSDARLATLLREKSAGLDVEDHWIEECARDLVDHRNASAVIAGDHLSVEAHQLVIYLNELLGANEHTVQYVSLPADEAHSIESLSEKIGSGSIDSLLVLGGNPVYNAPGDLGWKSLQKKVPEVIRFGYYFDETSLEADVNIASSHYLETWGDGRTFDGTYVPVQPMIQPLFPSFAETEILARLAGRGVTDNYGLVLETFRKEFDSAGEGEKGFQRLLSEGYAPGSAFSARNSRVSVSDLKDHFATTKFDIPQLGRNSLEIRLMPDDSVGDGYYCNNGWLQECPDPMTKLTWDNAIIISPKLALELGFDTKTGEFLIGGVAKKSSHFKRGREVAPMAKLEFGGKTIKAPVHIQPGLADWTLVLPLGYGRTQVGRVGEGCGFNFYPLLKSEGQLASNGAKITLVEDTYYLANTQEHWSMEGRAIYREANAETHAKNPHWVSEMGMESHSPAIYGASKNMSLAEKSLENPRGGSSYDTPDFGEPPPNVDVWKDPEARKKFIPEQQWGMSIDLNTCTGCNACIIACQSENNIPIVGKDQIMRGREMHWIRLDRYYSSGELEENRHSLPSDPQASLMPVACLHCEMAPCEQVCPVNATVHDRQGLNVMAYNRCVGTRYCANNCPYKVRRFNFFDYNKRSSDEFYSGPLGTDQYKTEGGVMNSMQRNPDVTVRMRGVMEKCTYCVQRIEQAKIAQRVKAKDSNDIKIPDGIIRTACQAACPTEAIVFGDISDNSTAVSRAKHNDRDYALLGYLNTRPRTTYLARLRNPNPAMPDYERVSVALSRKEYKSSQPGQGKKGEGHGDNGHAAEPESATPGNGNH